MPARARRAAAVLALGLVLGWPGDSAAGSVTDLAGRPTDAAIPNALAVVLVFVQPECPISNRYAPELARLAAECGPRGVAFRLVYAGEVPAEDARAHHEDYFRTFEALLDPDADLARRTGVTVLRRLRSSSPVTGSSIGDASTIATCRSAASGLAPAIAISPTLSTPSWRADAGGP
ncbi:MAG: hypothetical protein R2991_05750 [Thermoanaerobaculia bacterium]